ncbi:MAG TPA: 4,5-DOPA dioxygenase extradiol [Methanomicrobiales archaeon]|nr:4,5-DOPA dioxygenase extradiol [Methanomicrobiales archaeon]
MDLVEATGKPAAGARMPVLFIGHGSPMNMVLSNSYTRSLDHLGPTLPRPRAIMVISAHWLTHGTFVGCMDRPRMIYDFSGFPEKLYQVKYPCPGAPAPARQVTGLDGARGLVRCDEAWGLDHASYSVLRHLFPAADIPVFEMSLDYSFNDWHPKQVSYHYKLARRLRPLRDEGILVIGSGNMVHNLDLVDFADMDASPHEWAVAADEAMRSRLLAGDHRGLVDYLSMGETASLAVPTLDHYLPMIYAIALQEEGEEVRFTHEGFQNASVSMRSFRIG